jgi:hypothetical protein
LIDTERVPAAGTPFATQLSGAWMLARSCRASGNRRPATLRRHPVTDGGEDAARAKTKLALTSRWQRPWPIRR